MGGEGWPALCSGRQKGRQEPGGCVEEEGQDLALDSSSLFSGGSEGVLSGRDCLGQGPVCADLTRSPERVSPPLGLMAALSHLCLSVLTWGQEL